MPCAKPLVLIAACLLSACATSTPPSPPPTLPPPEACTTPCPPLPPLANDDELAAVIWTYELIDAAGECRRLHTACGMGR